MQKQVYEHIKLPIQERKTCPISGQEFPIFENDRELLDKMSPVIYGKKYIIPSPSICPEERSKRRFAWRNERSLYRRKCDFSGKNIISIYSPDKPYRVYDQKVRWGDERDAMSFGKKIDYTKPFFQQFEDLFKEVPTPNVFNTNGENSDYCNHVGDMKNCYMASASWDNEDIIFASKSWQCKNCIDILESFNCTQCYELISCDQCHKVFRSQQAENCSNSAFLFGCRNCENCLGCYNVNNKKYHILNKEYNRKEYEEAKEKIFSSNKSIQEFQNQRLQTSTQWIHPQSKTIQASNSYGDRINNCRDCFHCYNIEESENCRYCENGAGGVKDSLDGFGMGLHMSLGYEVIDTGVDTFINCFTVIAHGCKNAYYCHNCHNSSHIFGCIGLKNKEYCIFNKQYTKEEYEKNLAKLIEHMQSTGERGEFFPASIAPFGYNETVGSEYHPDMTKDEILKRGWKRYEKNNDIHIPDGANIVKSQQLESLTSQIFTGQASDDEILKSIFICEESGRPFRIIKQELEFYNKLQLPLPRLHPDIRHLRRVQQRPGRKLFLRTCDKTGKQILSVYPQDVPFKVYSENAYNQEIY